MFELVVESTCRASFLMGSQQLPPPAIIQQKSELGSWHVGLNGHAQVPEVWATSPAHPAAVDSVLLKSVDFRLCLPLGDSSPVLFPQACILLA